MHKLFIINILKKLINLRIFFSLRIILPHNKIIIWNSQKLQKMESKKMSLNQTDESIHKNKNLPNF